MGLKQHHCTLIEDGSAPRLNRVGLVCIPPADHTLTRDKHHPPLVRHSDNNETHWGKGLTCI